ncbi:winged helix-turn-helix domain-containing protein [Streptomyces sp. NPDC059185]
MGGGLTPEGRQRRETVRMQAAELSEQQIEPSEVARRLLVSMKSAHQWHQLWRDGGVQIAGGHADRPEVPRRLQRLGRQPGLMHRLGFSPPVPARRVAERDELAVTVWKEAPWAEVKGPGRPAGDTSVNNVLWALMRRPHLRDDRAAEPSPAGLRRSQPVTARR